MLARLLLNPLLCGIGRFCIECGDEIGSRGECRGEFRAGGDGDIKITELLLWILGGGIFIRVSREHCC